MMYQGSELVYVLVFCHCEFFLLNDKRHSSEAGEFAHLLAHMKDRKTTHPANPAQNRSGSWCRNQERQFRHNLFFCRRSNRKRRIRTCSLSMIHCLDRHVSPVSAFSAYHLIFKVELASGFAYWHNTAPTSFSAVKIPRFAVQTPH